MPEFDWSFIEKTCLDGNGSCVSVISIPWMQGYLEYLLTAIQVRCRYFQRQLCLQVFSL